MKLRRRTGVLLFIAFVAVSVGVVGYRLLRPERLRRFVVEALQGALVEGATAEVDAVAWSWSDGIRAEGIRIRGPGGGEPLVEIPSLRAGTRLWALLRHGSVTDVELEDPVIRLLADGSGAFPLAKAFRAPAAPAGGDVPSGHPRVRVRNGTLLFSSPELLAAGEVMTLGIETLELQESTGSRPAALTAALLETGSSVRPGEGALGRLVVRGTWPPGSDGLAVHLQRFDAGSVLRDRLSPALRRAVEGVEVEGTVGTTDGLPGLEVVLTGGVGGEPLVPEIVLRPEDLLLMVRGFPALFTGVKGEVRWRDGVATIETLELHRGGAEIHADGSLDLTDPADPAGKVRFWARDLYLDSGLRGSLPPAVRRIWDAYDFSGTVDVTEAPPGTEGVFDSHLEFPGRGAPPQLRVAVQLRDAVVTYRGYPDDDGVRHGFAYTVTEATGRVLVQTVPEGTRIRLEGIEARHGDVVVRGNGDILDYGNHRAAVRVDVFARDLPLDDEVRRAFSDPAVFDRWGPEGTAAEVQVVVLQDPDLDEGAHEAVLVRFDGRASFRYAGFPLRIDNVTGVVEERKDRVGRELVPRTTLQGIRGTRPDGAVFQVDGSVEGTGDQRLNLDIRGTGVSLDEPLRTAVASDDRRDAAVESWDRLGPSGRADVRASVTGTASDTRVAVDLDLGGGVAVTGWGDIRFPAENLTGSVRILPGLVEMRSIAGDGAAGAVRIPEGSVREVDGVTRVEMILEADDFPLDDSIRPDLGPVAERASGMWDFLRPAPGFRADLRVHLRGPADAIDASVTARGLQGGIRPLGLRNLDIGGGTVTYDSGIVVLEGVEGSMANRDLVVKEGRLDLGAGSGTLAFEVRRLRFPRDLLGLLPEETVDAVERLAPDRYFHVENLRVALSEEWRRMVLDGDLSLSPQREGPSEGLGLEGVFGLRGLTVLRSERENEPALLSGRLGIREGVLLAGVPLRRLGAEFELGGAAGAGGTVRAVMSGAEGLVAGRRLVDGSAVLLLGDGDFTLQDFRGSLARGELEASFHAGQGKPAYQGRVSLRNAHARDLFSPDDSASTVRGRVSGDFAFRNPTGEFAALRGESRLELRDGYLTELNTFKAIFNFLRNIPVFGNYLVGDTVFTSAELVVHLRGDQAIVDKLELRSSFVELVKAGGASDIWLDGRVDVGLVPNFNLRDNLLNLKLTDTVLSVAWAAISPFYRQFHQFRIRGTLQNPVVQNDILPGLTQRPDGRILIEAPPPLLVPEAQPSIDF